VKLFALLLEQLVYSSSRNQKIRHLITYFSQEKDPDRGFAVAAIAGTLQIPNITSSVIRKLIEDRVDPELFRLSYDYVGDLAETVSLVWPSNITSENISLYAATNTLASSSRSDAPKTLAMLLDRLGQSERFALLKLITGGLRVGVSARLLKIALGKFGNKNVIDIEELWFGLTPPYTDLFEWLEGKAKLPNVDRALLFRPVMLAHPIVKNDLKSMSAKEFIAEWKWDGVRVQAIAYKNQSRLYTRTGEDISRSFPDVLDQINWQGVIDGELLVVQKNTVQPFEQLQKRLGRKKPTKQILDQYPAHIMAYDILENNREDLRSLTFLERRRHLEEWFALERPKRISLSEIISVSKWSDLTKYRDLCRLHGYEGLVLKRRQSPYLVGRKKGHWYKWKRDPLSAECILMYAKRGHGKRSSYYSDYTFGCWSNNNDNTLMPVGKAYSGYTDDDLLRLDKYVRDNTTERFGPVRSINPSLVLEIAFDAVQFSNRHKSGIAMRFPRIKRVRWDKPANEADSVEKLRQMVDQSAFVKI
tara:strand:- start:12463 stop:14055 length:1593 start_codon:yes stop_codon:yes gene_type:complete